MNNKKFAGFVIIFLIIFMIACDQNKPVVPESVYNKKDQVSEGFTSDSFAYYEGILAKDTANIELRLAIATNYYADRQYNKAIEHLLKVVSQSPKNPEALITLGNVYYDADDNEKAIIYYEKALQLDPKNVNVRCDLATCYLNLKQPEKSLALLKKNIEIDPKHAQSHHNLSVVYKDMGKTKEAEQEMKIFNSLGK